MLEQKHKSMPTLSPSLHARISTFRSDLFATERDFAHRSQLIEGYERKVRDIEATLIATKDKLAEEKILLEHVAARKSDIQDALQTLEQQAKEKENLESQMLAKKSELIGLLKLARQFKDGLATNTSRGTIELTSLPSPDPAVDSSILESDVPQNNLKTTDNDASRFENNVDAHVYDLHSESEGDIFHDSEAKEDSDYIECDAATDEGRSF